MRTTLDIPERLINDLLKVLKLSKKNEAVRIAIDDFVRRKKRENLLNLKGGIDIEDMSKKIREAERDESHR